MNSDKPTVPDPMAVGPEAEAEIRALLLRLLRLVAAEVAERLRRNEAPVPSRPDAPDGPLPAPGR